MFILCRSLGLFIPVTSLKVRLILQFISKHVKLQILIKLPAISDKYLANFPFICTLARVHFGPWLHLFSLQVLPFPNGRFVKEVSQCMSIIQQKTGSYQHYIMKMILRKTAGKKKKNPHRHVKEGEGVVYKKSRRSIKIPFKCCIPRVNCTLSANSSTTGKLVWKKKNQTCILGGDNISCFATNERLTNENKL